MPSSPDSSMLKAMAPGYQTQSELVAADTPCFTTREKSV